VSKRKQQKSLPLASPHWTKLNDAYRDACTRTSSDLAIAELEQGFAAGRLHAKAEWLDQGRPKQKLLEPKFWADLEIRRWQNGVALFPHDINKRLPSGTVIHVWKPDLETIWPTEAPATTAPVDEPKPQRRKPGPEPTADWPMRVARELIRRARAGEKMPTARQMCQWCEDNVGYQPDIRAMQRLLRELLS
jgi:hypothetical protein